MTGDRSANSEAAIISFIGIIWLHIRDTRNNVVTAGHVKISRPAARCRAWMHSSFGGHRSAVCINVWIAAAQRARERHGLFKPFCAEAKRMEAEMLPCGTTALARAPLVNCRDCSDFAAARARHRISPCAEASATPTSHVSLRVTVPQASLGPAAKTQPRHAPGRSPRDLIANRRGKQECPVLRFHHSPRRPPYN